MNFRPHAGLFLKKLDVLVVYDLSPRFSSIYAEISPPWVFMSICFPKQSFWAASEERLLKIIPLSISEIACRADCNGCAESLGGAAWNGMPLQLEAPSCGRVPGVPGYPSVVHRALAACESLSKLMQINYWESPDSKNCWIWRDGIFVDCNLQIAIWQSGSMAQDRGYEGLNRAQHTCLVDESILCY